MVDVGFRIRSAQPGELAELMRLDDAACAIFAEVGMALSLPPEHPFVLSDAERWGRSVARGDTYVAIDDLAIIGFATLELVDDAPYLDQLSVLPRAMRRGVGQALLQQAVAWSGARPLWLTTYAHVVWNAPYYARHGFVRVPEPEWGPDMTRTVAAQRAALPAPEQRIVMVRRPHAAG